MGLLRFVSGELGGANLNVFVDYLGRPCRGRRGRWPRRLMAGVAIVTA